MPPKKGKSKKPAARKREVDLPADAEGLSLVLGKILTPNDEIIREGMRVLRVFLDSPVCVPALMQQLSENQTYGIRQLAAIALRKRIQDHWSELAPGLRDMVREALLSHLLSEPNVNVRNSCVSLVSAIARMDMPTNQWPALVHWVWQAVSSTDPAHNDFGLNLLRLLFAAVPKAMAQHRPRACEVFESFVVNEHAKLQTRALRGLHTLYSLIRTQEELDRVVAMMPTFLQVFRTAVENEETEMLTALFEILSSTSSPDFPLSDEMVGQVMLLMADLMGNREMQLDMRTKACQFLIEEVTARPAHITRMGLIERMFEVIFGTLTEVDDNSFTGETMPHSIGIDLFCTMQENLSKVQVVQACLPHIDRLMGSALPNERAAGLLAFSTLMQDCSAMVMGIENGITFRNILMRACQLLSDPADVVGLAACIVIVNISDTEDFEHPIFALHADILPALIAILRGNPTPRRLNKCLLALDGMCERLGASIVHYYTELMAITQELFSQPSVEIQAYTISVVKSVAVACREHFVPYFPALVQFLTPMLSYEAEEQMELRAKATECLGKAAHAVGVQNWTAEFQQVIDPALKGFLVQGDNQYLVHELTFTFFERLVAAWGPETPQDLANTVIAHALDTLQSQDGIEHQNEEDDEGGHIRGFDDDSEAEEEEDTEGQGDIGGHDAARLRAMGLTDDEIAARAAAEAEEAEDEDEDEDDDNSPLVLAVDAFEVKLEAAQFLITAISCLGPRFDMELFAKMQLHVQEMVCFPYPLLRNSMLSVMLSIGNFVANLYPNPQGKAVGEARPLHPEAEKIMRNIFDAVVATIVSDRMGNVVAVALDVMTSFIKSFGLAAMPVDNPAYAPRITYLTDFMRTLKLLAEEKARCQSSRDVVDIDADTNFSVFDSLGDLLGVMAEAMGAQFQPIFNELLPPIIALADPRRPDLFRNTAVGTVAELVYYMGPVEHENAETLAQIAITYLADPVLDVVDNAIYLAGVLAERAGASMVPHLPAFLAGILAFMQRAVEAEAAPAIEGATVVNDVNCGRDNAASALVRIVLAAPHVVDLTMAIPAIFSLLPCKLDHAEAALMYPELPKVYELAPQLVAPELPRLVAAVADHCATGFLLEEVQDGLIAWLKHLAPLHPGVIEAAAAALPDAHRDIFMACMNK